MDSGYPVHRMNISDSELCMVCGMCCDGSIFEYVNLRSDEQETMIPLGLTVELVGGKHLGFLQPCSQFKDGLCKIYAQRPHVCANFHCKLLRSYHDGNITREDAIFQIGRAKQLYADAQKLMPESFPDGFSSRNLRKMVARLTAETPDVRRRCAEFLFAAQKYELIIQKHFFDVRKMSNLSVEK